MVLDITRSSGAVQFSTLAGAVMEAFMLRETNVKDLVARLAKDGHLENTWRDGRRKPSEGTTIRLRKE
jgi:hypothetical protein